MSNNVPQEVKDVLSSVHPKLSPNVMAGACLCCGGRQASIRGRHPGMPDRIVCPTCVVERLEDMVSSLQAPVCKANV